MKYLNPAQLEALRFYYKVEVDSFQELVKECDLKQVDNKLIHDMVYFSAEVWLDELSEQVLIIGKEQAKNKIIYYVGGENSAELCFYSNGIWIYDNLYSRFERYLTDAEESAAD